MTAEPLWKLEESVKLGTPRLWEAHRETQPASLRESRLENKGLQLTQGGVICISLNQYLKIDNVFVPLVSVFLFQACQKGRIFN